LTIARTLLNFKVKDQGCRTRVLYTLSLQDKTMLLLAIGLRWHHCYKFTACYSICSGQP